MINEANTYRIEFDAASAAVRRADPEAVEGYDLITYFGGNTSEVFVVARAGGMKHRWLVTFHDSIDRLGYAVGVWYSVRDCGNVVLS